MKLISLNTWGCRVTKPIFQFIKENSESTDVFCFQEILKDGNGKTPRGELKNSYEEIQKLLPHHTGYFSEYVDGYYGEDSKKLDFKFGIACYARADLKQNFAGAIPLLNPTKKWTDYEGRFAAGSAMALSVEEYAIINTHGLWQNSIKEDTEAKIEQSKKILDLAEKTAEKKIICGDFNLLPDTLSIKMLSDKYENLIEEYGVKDTRGVLYEKDVRYSDYAFLDRNIAVKNFSVPNIQISDHLPLLITF